MEGAASSQRIGRVLEGRYRLLEVLGEGGMGTVFAAEQIRLGRKVAIKTIHAHLAHKEMVVQRFRREAMAAANAGSPHIVDVFDLGVMADGTPFMVMEFVDGQDLHTRVESSGPLSVRDAAHVIRQACDALESAHELGVVHRDVKPENIMVTRRRKDPLFVKMVDFGISKLRDSSLTGTSDLLGTPYAMAPEQLRAAAHVDGRADVYGLGVCLYYALSGRVPYEAQHLPLLISEIMAGRGAPLRAHRPGLPESVYAIVETAMAHDPDRRFQSASALAGALRSLEGRSPSGRPAAMAFAPTASMSEPTATPQAPPRLPPVEERAATSGTSAKPAPHEQAQAGPAPKVPERRGTQATLLMDGPGSGIEMEDDEPVVLPQTTGARVGKWLFVLGVVAILVAGGAFVERRYGVELGWRDPPATRADEPDPAPVPETHEDDVDDRGNHPQAPTGSRGAVVVVAPDGVRVVVADQACVGSCLVAVPPGVQPVIAQFQDAERRTNVLVDADRFSAVRFPAEGGARVESPAEMSERQRSIFERVRANPPALDGL